MPPNSTKRKMGGKSLYTHILKRENLTIANKKVLPLRLDDVKHYLVDLSRVSIL